MIVVSSKDLGTYIGMSAVPGDPSYIPLSTTDAIDHIQKLGHYTYEEASTLKNILSKIRDLKNNKDEYNRAFKQYLLEAFGGNAVKMQNVFQSFSVKFAQNAAAAAAAAHQSGSSNYPVQASSQQQQQQQQQKQQQNLQHQQQLLKQHQEQFPRPMLPPTSQQMKPSTSKAKNTKQMKHPIEENEIDKELEKPSDRLSSDLGDYIKTTDTAITYDIITDDLVQEEEEISKNNLRESILGSLGVDTIVTNQAKKKKNPISCDDDIVNIESSGGVVKVKKLKNKNNTKRKNNDIVDADDIEIIDFSGIWALENIIDRDSCIQLATDTLSNTGVTIDSDALEMLSKGVQTHLKHIVDVAGGITKKSNNYSNIVAYHNISNTIEINNVNAKYNVGMLFGPNIIQILASEEDDAMSKINESSNNDYSISSSRKRKYSDIENSNSLLSIIQSIVKQDGVQDMAGKSDYYSYPFTIANNNIEVPKNVVIATNDIINALEQCGSNLSKTNGTRNKKKLGSSSRVYTYCVN